MWELRRGRAEVRVGSCDSFFMVIEENLHI